MLQRAPRAAPGRHTPAVRQAPSKRPCAPPSLRLATSLPARPSTVAPPPRVAPLARRQFSTERNGKRTSKEEDEDDDKDSKERRGAPPDFNITPWTRFVALPYKPKKVSIVHRVKRWWNKLSRWNIDEKEFLDGAKQAFLTISPFLVYGSPLPSLVELRSMLEPELVRHAWRAKREGESGMVPGLVQLVSADVLTVELGLALPVERLLEQESKEERSLKRFAGLRTVLSVAVRFHTKEEVKSFGGIPQMSPTRFFDMEHIWVFVRRLPPKEELVQMRAKGEEIPNTPWRLAKPIAFYPAHLQVDLRRTRGGGKAEEEEDD